MVLMMLADGEIDEAEINLMQDIYRKLAEVELTVDDTKEIISEVRGDKLTIQRCLEGFSYRLNDHGKELVIKAAFMIATADGSLERRERKMLSEIGKTLEVSSAHFNGIIQEMLEP